MPFVPDKASRFVPDDTPQFEKDAAAGPAAEMPEWERRAAAVGASMSAPVEGTKQLALHMVGSPTAKAADQDANDTATAMKKLYKASPAARNTGLAADIAGAFLMPGFKGATIPGKIAAGAGTGALYAGSNPVTGGNFATEKAKQVGTGAALGGTLSAGVEAATRALLGG